MRSSSRSGTPVPDFRGGGWYPLAMPQYRRAKLHGGTFFFTVVTYRRRPVFANPMTRTLLGGSCCDCLARGNRAFDRRTVTALSVTQRRQPHAARRCVTARRTAASSSCRQSGVSSSSRGIGRDGRRGRSFTPCSSSSARRRATARNRVKGT